jgi:hypothetical protein
MGSGGEAPPVKTNDVLILIGASILLAAFITHAWAKPILIAEEPIISEYDLFSSDEVEITWVGNLSSIEITMDGMEQVTPDFVESSMIFKASESGTYTFVIDGDEGVEVTVSTSRALMIDWLLYPLGAIMLAFGLWKKIVEENDDDDDEILDALIED